MSEPVAASSPTAERLTEVLGAEGLTWSNGVAVALPRTDDEVAALMRLAAREGWRVRPAGRGMITDGEPDGQTRVRPVGPRSDRSNSVVGGTTEGDALDPTGPEDASEPPGPEPDGPGLVICTARMDELLEHEPGDLMVRARAGLRLSRLQSEVAQAGQWLALDPPGDPDMTVGRLVARGQAGPLRAMYGRPRDQVLGLTLVDGRGRILRLGGRVVKNVAGFDLVRFATGSRGVLGVITEVTLRLYPIPQADITLVWKAATPSEGWELGRALATQPLPIAAAELIGGAWPGTGLQAVEEAEAATRSSIRIMIRLQGSAAAVGRMSGVLSAYRRPAECLEGRASGACWAAVAAGSGRSTGELRIHTLPDRGRSVVRALHRAPVARYALHLLEGTVRGELDRSLDEEERADLRSAAAEAGGTLTLRSEAEPPDRPAPTRQRSGVDGVRGGGDGHGRGVEGPGREVEGLRARLIRRFDPDGILPGSWREGGSEEPAPGEAAPSSGGVVQ